MKNNKIDLSDTDKQKSLLTNDDLDPSIYKKHPYRFVVFIIYCLMNLFIGTFTSAYVPIQDGLRLVY